MSEVPNHRGGLRDFRHLGLFATTVPCASVSVNLAAMLKAALEPQSGIPQHSCLRARLDQSAQQPLF